MASRSPNAMNIFSVLFVSDLLVILVLLTVLPFLKTLLSFAYCDTTLPGGSLASYPKSSLEYFPPHD